MKVSAAVVAVFAASMYNYCAAAGINSAGVPTSCGQNTCCIPSCQLGWTDSAGCSGDAAITGACSNAFSTADSTQDSGVDICNGAGAFFCGRDGGGRVVFVVNRQDGVSAAAFPASYNECTLSGQCAPCDQQASCQDPVSIGTSSAHNCAAFNALLSSSGANLPGC